MLEERGACAPTDQAKLAALVERAIREQTGRQRRVLRVACRPSPYRTSFPLEEVDTELDDGTVVHLLRKWTARAALDPAVRAAKPAFLHNPRRENETYRRILAPHAIETARYYGESARAGESWFLIERISGPVLWEVGNFRAWEAAASWIAGFHSRFLGRADCQTTRTFLLRHDAEYYERWLHRARRFAVRSERDGKSQRRIEWLADRHRRVVDRLLALPLTIIHGEYYPSNILVQPMTKCGAAGWRICPIDWEMAAVGPGLLDLAALLSGRWTDDQRQALARAYSGALGADAGLGESQTEFSVQLAACRLQLAIQWLGWSAGWIPPSSHRQDWLSEAVELAETFGF